VDERFCEVGRGVTLCYETFGDRSDPPALLIMGLGTQMVAWHEDFCAALAERGLYVVRFDNRDIGRSTHMTGAPPSMRQLLTRSRRAAHYTLADMAEDARGLLAALELEPAHVIGASMGGMIAQTLAARSPASVRSLTSIMSSTGSLRSGQPALRVYTVFLRRAPRERAAYIDHMQRLFAAIGSPGFPTDAEDIRELAALSYDRDHDADAPGRQLAAIIASGNRTPELSRITAPTLVIHGTGDRLVAPSGGRATARAIRGARLAMIPGMGHDLPRGAWPRLIEEIVTHVQRTQTAAAGRDTSAAPPATGVRAGPTPLAP
jgi:pimeloyl-ACP methyl ester carboxylesterase